MRGNSTANYLVMGTMEGTAPMHLMMMAVMLPQMNVDLVTTQGGCWGCSLCHKVQQGCECAVGGKRMMLVPQYMCSTWLGISSQVVHCLCNLHVYSRCL